MAYKLLADLVVICHFLFILFVLLGGLLAFRWRWAVWLHVPSAIWGAAISLFGLTCPLTHLEVYLREKAGAAAFNSGFVQEYILPVVYPRRLFGDFPQEGFVLIGLLVLAVNAVIYWRLYHRLTAR